MDTFLVRTHPQNRSSRKQCTSSRKHSTSGTNRTHPANPTNRARRGIRTTLPSLLAAGTLALTLAACGVPGTAATPPSPAAGSLEARDVWVKASDGGMSAAFGELRNTSDHEVVVVAATSPAAGNLELHATVENASGQRVMQQIPGGFTIPAHGTLDLEPGGNHIMLMDLAGPLRAGQEVEFTLEFSDHSTLDFPAPAKDYAGANESYHGDNGNGASHADNGTGASHGDNGTGASRNG